MLDVSAHETMCQRRSPQTFQVDHEKSDLGADVNEPKALVEFDAVDNLHLSRFEIDVLGAEVSMTIADSAFLYTLGKPGSTAGREGAHRLPDLFVGLFG